MREIYIGNGKTIMVEPSTTTYKEYDFDKLQQYLNEGKEFEAGMQEDWYWTAEPVTQENIDNKSIGGISKSYWATPSVSFDDGDTFENCYIELPIEE